MTNTIGITAVIALVCLVASVTLANAALGPALGITHTTGVQDDVEESEEELKDEAEGGVTDQGEFSPIAGLSRVSTLVSLLPKVPQILINLGIPAPIANYLGAPWVVIAGVTVVMVVLRFRL